MLIDHCQMILYVSDQKRSRDFYSALLGKEPSLDVPGMTEFVLSDKLKLGLMPESGIAKILSDKTPHPSTGNGTPRCELYLKVANPDDVYRLAVSLGAKEISAVTHRDWGDTVGYVSDFDGHILAFASGL